MKRTSLILMATLMVGSFAMAQQPQSTPLPRPGEMPSLQARPNPDTSPAAPEKACPHHAQQHACNANPVSQPEQHCGKHQGDPNCEICDKKPGHNGCNEKRCDKEPRKTTCLEMGVGMGSINAINYSSLSLIHSNEPVFHAVGESLELGIRLPSATSFNLYFATSTFQLNNAINEMVSLNQVGLAMRAYQPIRKRMSFVYGVGIEADFRLNNFELTNPTNNITTSLSDNPEGIFGLGCGFEAGIEYSLSKDFAVRVVAFADFANTQTFSSTFDGTQLPQSLAGFDANPYHQITTVGLRCSLPLLLPIGNKSH